MLALLEVEESTCAGCGGWLEETTDPANAERYLAHEPVRCHRCTALARKADDLARRGTDHQHALRIPVELRPR